MTDQEIPDAAVEAAARALDPQTMGSGGRLAEKFQAQTRAEARRVLEAAAPYMQRTITTTEDLDALPTGSVVTDGAGSIYRKLDRSDGVGWYEPGEELNWDALELNLPATVLQFGWGA